MKIWLLVSCFTVVQHQFAIAQCVNRPPCNVINEPMVETSRSIISQPVPQPFPAQNAVTETPCTLCNSVHQMPTSNVFPAPTTIITDYSPAVCKNLADTLQMMVVCNLLQNNRGSSDLALQFASPILKEVLSSPSFSCGCTNPLFSNPSLPSAITASFLNPNVVSSPNFYSSLPQKPIGNSCNNGLISNILGLLRN